jgi:hypothetical protein
MAPRAGPAGASGSQRAAIPGFAMRVSRFPPGESGAAAMGSGGAGVAALGRTDSNVVHNEPLAPLVLACIASYAHLARIDSAAIAAARA